MANTVRVEVSGLVFQDSSVRRKVLFVLLLYTKACGPSSVTININNRKGSACY